MREHELRRQVVSEMHLRRWPLLQLPVAVFQWVLEVGPGEREAERGRAERARVHARAGGTSTSVSEPPRVRV